MNYLLIVDDSPFESQLARRLLEKTFHERIKSAVNGWDALELIEEQLPLAVITDLQMPVVDGLQLTERIHQRFPSVPVILMTAHGSEEIAGEALARGAVDFVPKSMLAGELCHAVESALAVSASAQRDPRLSRCLRREQLHFELDNDLLLIPPLVAHLRETARQVNLVGDAESMRLAKALIEALRNAVFHGNLELSSEELAAMRVSPGGSDVILQRLLNPRYSRRHVTVTTSISSEEGRFTIRDEGPGFDSRALANLTLDPSQLTSTKNRGLLLIQTFMDEVRFNERGNEITLIKRKPPAATVAAS